MAVAAAVMMDAVVMAIAMAMAMAMVMVMVRVMVRDGDGDGAVQGSALQCVTVRATRALWGV